MAKLVKKVKVREQKHSRLISIPKAMADMMEIYAGDSVLVTYDKDKIIVEAVKKDE